MRPLHQRIAELETHLSDFDPAVPNTAEFWAAKLGFPVDQAAATLADGPKFQNLLRFKLMKRGGVGYVQPSYESFPPVEEFHQLIIECGALPCATWLDGMSAGEQAIEELLELLISKGVVALNIIPPIPPNLLAA